MEAFGVLHGKTTQCFKNARYATLAELPLQSGTCIMSALLAQQYSYYNVSSSTLTKPLDELVLPDEGTLQND
jgi:hypothetical protein